jgi:NAD(P)-dependent dehydrogenase (short-subunit alcohol dehydrogenase family)
VAVVIVALYFIKQHFRGGKYRHQDIDLKGKTAVITGGNSGIGAETVKYMVSLGCSVIIGARDRKTAEKVIKKCKDFDQKANV